MIGRMLREISHMLNWRSCLIIFGLMMELSKKGMKLTEPKLINVINNMNFLRELIKVQRYRK
jgi:hypothetical protein